MSRPKSRNGSDSAADDSLAEMKKARHRLVVDNPARPDDRSRAKFLIHVGADYYPETSTRVAAT